MTYLRVDGHTDMQYEYQSGRRLLRVSLEAKESQEQRYIWRLQTMWKKLSQKKGVITKVNETIAVA